MEPNNPCLHKEKKRECFPQRTHNDFLSALWMDVECLEDSDKNTKSIKRPPGKEARFSSLTVVCAFLSTTLYPDLVSVLTLSALVSSPQCHQALLNLSLGPCVIVYCDILFFALQSQVYRSLSVWLLTLPSDPTPFSLPHRSIATDMKYAFHSPKA